MEFSSVARVCGSISSLRTGISTWTAPVSTGATDSKWVQLARLASRKQKNIFLIIAGVEWNTNTEVPC